MNNLILFFLSIILFTSCAPTTTRLPATETPLPHPLVPSTSPSHSTTTPSVTNSPRPSNTSTPIPESWLQDLVYTAIPFSELSDMMENRWFDSVILETDIIDDPTAYFTNMSENKLFYYLQVTVPSNDRVWIISCLMYFYSCESAANIPNLSGIQKSTIRAVWTDGKQGTAFDLPESIWKINLEDKPALNYKLLGNLHEYIELAELTASVSKIQNCSNIENETHFCGEKGDHYFLVPVQPAELIPGFK